MMCPLCESADALLLDNIDSDALSRAYIRAFDYQPKFASKTLEEYRCRSCGLGFFNPLPEPDPALYEVLQVQPWYYVKDKPEFDIACRMLQGCDDLLEVGAGAAHFAGKVGGMRYTGLEFNEKAISAAKTAGVNLLPLSLEEYSKSHAGSHGAVVAFQVLEHLPDPAGFIHSAVECLRPGGRLVVSVPNQDGVAGVVVDDILDLPPHHYTKWSRRCFESIAFRFDVVLQTLETDSVSGDYHRLVAHAECLRKARKLLGMSPSRRQFGPLSRIADRMARMFCSGAGSDVLSELVQGPSIVACFVKPN